MADIFKNLWVEKYRPKLLKDIILTDVNRGIFENIILKNEIPNIILIGNPGIGKTSLAKILTIELDSQYLYINASDENGIETVRSKVTNFSRTKSLDGQIKIVILDEVDGLTQDAQRALRNTMEEYSGFTRFILTANYKHRVIPALQSRCQSFDLTPPLDTYLNRVEHVLESESVIIDPKDKKVLKQFAKNNYPDLRKAINEIQKACTSGELELPDQQASAFVNQIFKLVQSKAVLKMRKSVIESEEKFNSDYPKLLKDIFNHIESVKLDDMKKKESLLIIADHLYRSPFVADQEINFFSCMIAVEKAVT